MIVIIDTGIDYTSPVFRNPDGSSRILAIWDRTVQTGAAPEGGHLGGKAEGVQGLFQGFLSDSRKCACRQYEGSVMALAGSGE
ncbi:MAG: hypothetical protein NC123_17810 [Butyrivibrio sp.]|nr:hypothetical protein [Butyrivibrio sp.]